MLSCTCGFDSDADWYFQEPDDFILLNTKNRRRCSSCKSPIDVGSECLEFLRWRYPISDIEIKRYGDGTEIHMSSFYMCSGCGEKYLNLSALGYCLDIETNMDKYLKEYQEITGFKEAV